MKTSTVKSLELWCFCIEKTLSSSPIVRETNPSEGRSSFKSHTGSSTQEIDHVRRMVDFTAKDTRAEIKRRYVRPRFASNSFFALRFPFFCRHSCRQNYARGLSRRSMHSFRFGWYHHEDMLARDGMKMHVPVSIAISVA